MHSCKAVPEQHTAHDPALALDQQAPEPAFVPHLHRVVIFHLHHDEAEVDVVVTDVNVLEVENDGGGVKGRPGFSEGLGQGRMMAARTWSAHAT
jgi:hypothetical protein